MRLQWRRPLLALAAVASLSALSACTAFTYTPTPLPSEAPTPQPAPSAPASPAACRDNPLASYAPSGPTAHAGDVAERIHDGQDPKTRPVGCRSIGRHLSAGLAKPLHAARSRVLTSTW